MALTSRRTVGSPMCPRLFSMQKKQPSSSCTRADASLRLLKLSRSRTRLLSMPTSTGPEPGFSSPSLCVPTSSTFVLSSWATFPARLAKSSLSSCSRVDWCCKRAAEKTCTRSEPTGLWKTACKASKTGWPPVSEKWITLRRSQSFQARIFMIHSGWTSSTLVARGASGAGLTSSTSIGRGTSGAGWMASTSVENGALGAGWPSSTFV
mmetsp:Transcript_34385/g.81209  ORF Transcript_34385/g.81209 Transcript_34385/m.81209 type:complete len:208 (-) Transcript_34385:368-991(-)